VKDILIVQHAHIAAVQQGSHKYCGAIIWTEKWRHIWCDVDGL